MTTHPVLDKITITLNVDRPHEYTEQALHQLLAHIVHYLGNDISLSSVSLSTDTTEVVHIKIEGT